MFERKKEKKQLEAKFNEIQMNLENNYKDLTLLSRKEAKELFDSLKENGHLKDSDIAEYEKRLAEYDKKLEHYGHPDISSFLKERY